MLSAFPGTYSLRERGGQSSPSRSRPIGCDSHWDEWYVYSAGPRRYFGVRSRALLTEQEVSRSWRQIFKSDKIEAASFERAEQLLDELRPESPLRHRLTMELEELRSIHSRRVSVAT